MPPSLVVAALNPKKSAMSVAHALRHAWPSPGTSLSSTSAVLPVDARKNVRVPPLEMGCVPSAVWSMPCTAVHCFTNSVPFDGATNTSDCPCHTATRGYVPVNEGNASRTRIDHTCGVCGDKPLRHVCELRTEVVH